MVPLLVPLLAGGFATGVVIAAALERTPGLVGLALVAATLLVALRLHLRHRPWLFLASLLGASSLAGWTAGAAALRPRRPACHVSHHTGREEVRLVAVASSDAVPLPDGGERQLLAAEALIDEGRSVPLCGAVELQRPRDFPELTPGERVLLRGRLRPATGSRNPGAPSAQLRRLADDVGAILYGQPRRLVRLGAAPRPPTLSWVRGRVRRALEAAIPAGPRRQVVAALVLGDTALDPGLRQAYARSGTSHLLAVSGLHLSLVALGALALLRRALLWLPVLGGPDPGRRAAIPAAGVAVFYTLLAGAPPAASRACVMACAGFAALLLQRQPDFLRPLALAALGLLVWDPLNLFLASFQLSFLAVIAISMIASGPREPRPAGRGRRWLRWGKELFVASAAASLLTAPICAHHFHQVSLAGVLANMLAVPLTSFAVQPASMLGAALGAVHPTLGAPVLTLAGWLASALNGLCTAVSRIPGASLWVPLGWPAALGALALGLAVLIRGRERGPVRLRRLALLLGVVLLAVAGILSLRRHPGGELELTFLDVGQGDSTLVRFPDGYTVLVDGGGSMIGGDPGAAQVLPFLRAAGVDRLDLAVLSHPHPDHAAGLTTVLRELPVAELWVCWHDEPDPWLQALLDEARRRGVPVRPPRALERGGVRLRPIWPAGYAGLCADPGYSTNDNSVVLRLEHGRAAVLLAGDVEADAEHALLRARPGDLRADLLKVPHHGSARSSSLDFLRAVSPRLAVISCRAQNHFGFPAPVVLERYRSLGVDLARIDEHGAVEVRLSSSGELAWSPLSAPVP